MLHRVQILVLVVAGLLLTADNARAQVFLRLGTGWSPVSGGAGYAGWNYYPSWGGGFGGYGGGYSYYTGQVTLPGWEAAGYAPRMRAVLEPAAPLAQAYTQTSNIAAASLLNDRETIRPVADGLYDTLTPRSGVGTRYAFPASYGGYSCGVSSYGYR